MTHKFFNGALKNKFRRTSELFIFQVFYLNMTFVWETLIFNKLFTENLVLPVVTIHCQCMEKRSLPEYNLINNYFCIPKNQHGFMRKALFVYRYFCWYETTVILRATQNPKESRVAFGALTARRKLRSLSRLHDLCSPISDIQGKFSVTTETWGRRQIDMGPRGHTWVAVGGNEGNEFTTLTPAGRGNHKI